MAHNATDQSAFIFRGFQSPNYTQVPDELFDELLPLLKEAELKVLLYIVRRTFGFKKERDPISFSQFINGITTKDGRSLDRGCGVKSPTHLSNALKSLEEKGIIVSHKSNSLSRGKQATEYSLHFHSGVLPEGEHPTTLTVVPPLPEAYAQETEVQETVRQQTDQDLSKIRKVHAPKKKDDHRPRSTHPAHQQTSKGGGEDSRIRQVHTEEEGHEYQDRVLTTDMLPDESGSSTIRKISKGNKPEPSSWDPINPGPSRSNGFESVGSIVEQFTPLQPPSAAEAREVIEQYIRDFARELYDAAPIKSSVTRAFRLYQQSGWTLDGFISALYEARAIAKERSATIQTDDQAKLLPAKRKMAYFFACLEDKLGLRK